MERISDEDLASIRDYAADSFESAPPPFKTVSGDLLYLMALEITALRNGEMTDEQIKYMVNRFLTWKLPEHFGPDNGISFDPIASKGTPYEFRREPVGTNLLSATQATEMVRHMIEGMPKS